ncbi:MAG: hypothetical protein RMJ67_01210 [Elusimicrobiota bacterium]|nr:hypothetical protein [Endomicrobiia bacterium]MDW8165122.1 hypothetical protein [Elusimicrobiota bacterium]
MQYPFNYEFSTMKYVIHRSYFFYTSLKNLTWYINLRANLLFNFPISFNFVNNEERTFFLKYRNSLLFILMLLFFDEYYTILYDMIEKSMKDEKIKISEIQKLAEIFFMEFIKNKKVVLSDISQLKGLIDKNEYVYKLTFDVSNEEKDTLPLITERSLQGRAILVSPLDYNNPLTVEFSKETKEQIIDKFLSMEKGNIVNVKGFSCYFYYYHDPNISELKNRFYIFEIAFVSILNNPFYFQDTSYRGFTFLFRDHNYIKEEDDRLELSSGFLDYNNVHDKGYLDEVALINQGVMSDYNSSYIYRL